VRFWPKQTAFKERSRLGEPVYRPTSQGKERRERRTQPDARPK
jgi:hypothetical protein